MVQATLIAYQTVKCWALTRTKKRMPKFDTLLPHLHDDGPQTPEQMRAVLERIRARVKGGKK